MTEQQPADDTRTPYERMGGAATFHAIVKRFYEAVQRTPDLHALYPEEDLGPAEDRLRMFLEQYWGGPKTYQEQRGHPRLRMRHFDYAVTPAQRDRWVHHMLVAVESLGLDPADAETMREYLVRAADFLVNADD